MKKNSTNHTGHNALKKKVILIGGTSYSGSTMLDMIIANDPKGISTGELFNLFNPSKDIHINDYDKDFWEQYRKKGYRHVYKNIFKQNPSKSFIVDSSKFIPWLKDQSNRAHLDNYDVYNILIYKTPTALAKSFSKRNRSKSFLNMWIKYHNDYIKTFNNFLAVNYDDFIKETKSLEIICKFIGIDFSPLKKNYCRQEYYTLFGNQSTKLFTKEKGSQEYSEALRMLKQRAESDNIVKDYQDYQTKNNQIDASIKFSAEEEVSIYSILNELRKHHNDTPQLQMNSLYHKHSSQSMRSKMLYYKLMSCCPYYLKKQRAKRNTSWINK